jgi:tRNA pseudouridine55 synthase
MIFSPDVPFPDPFPKGGILLVDKPLGWSSFDVVKKIRYHLSKKLGVKRIKIGHAGTLDPLATGLLILCVGDFTKKIETFQAMSKSYTGTIVFGATTASLDLEQPIEATYPVEHLTDALLQQVRQQFIGPVEQVPPIYSAIKIDGKRVYKNARTGQEVQIEPRTIHIESLTLGPLRPVSAQPEAMRIVSERGATIRQHPDYENGLMADFEVVCSKGTYIRTLAADLGLAVESGAYLSLLRRTATGGHQVDHAGSVETWVKWIISGV